MTPLIRKVPVDFPRGTITSIKFPQSWFDPSTGEARIESAHFKLGDGPCGKSVTSLHTKHQTYGFRILQRHTDGTSKCFTYPWDQIVGRIETEVSA